MSVFHTVHVTDIAYTTAPPTETSVEDSWDVGRWAFSRGGNEVAIGVPGMLTLDHNALMVEAAADGQSIAFVPEAVARPAIDAGRLLAVLEDRCPPLPGLCLYYPANRRAPAALHTFIVDLRLHT